MRAIATFFWMLISFAVIFALNKPWGSVPSLGKLLSPSHGFWQQIEASTPEIPSYVTEKELKKQVEVVWDENLIPHIFALNDEDLYFTQGYITASMRLWQMDFQTRAAAGRISEVVGDVALDFDKSMRRKGMLLGAQKSATASFADTNVRMAFNQYVAGINAYIKTLNTRNMPLEYKLLGMTPEKWDADRCILLLLYMANMLNTHNTDIENTNFVQAYGLDAFNNLFPTRDEKADPIVDWPGYWSFPKIPRNPMPTDIIPAPPADMADSLKPDPDNGSNNWAVTPTRTANGFAILANDPHLGLNLPSLWFTVHLNSPSQNVMGASLPGVAGIVIGFNEKIAWGFTNAQRDLVDWYKVQFANPQKTSILVDGIEEKVKMEVQKIKSKSGKTVYDTLWYSSFGVIANYTDLPKEPGTAWAYKWVGQDASRVAVAVMGLNKGADMNDFMEATNNFNSPAQNIVFADVAGNIGMRVQGNFLPRLPNEGVFLRDGTKAANRWPKYIPNYQNISVFNPERGFVSSANQYPADSTYPYFITSSGWESYRNRRINDMLRKDSAVTLDAMKTMQSDNFNLKASESLPLFLAALQIKTLSPEQKNIVAILQKWDFINSNTSREAVYYEAWWNAFYDLAWDEIDSATTPMAKPTDYRTIALLQEQPNLNFFDVLATPELEDGKALVQLAFTKALENVALWQKENQDASLGWATFKNTKITHLTRQMALSVQHVPIGGNRQIVNATSETHGPSWRQVVEMNPKEIKAFGIYPGGQSGNPGSFYYANWIPIWASGNYISLDIYSTPSTLYGKAIQSTTFSSSKP